MSSWLKKAQEDLLPAAPAAEPALGDPSLGDTEGLDLKPLSELEKDRGEADRIPNPTGNPEPVKPISMKELGGLLGTAGKSLQESLKDIQNASTAISKILTMGGHTTKDREIVSRAKEFVEKLNSLRNSAEELSGEMVDYRSDLATPTGSAGDWMSPPEPEESELL